MVWPPNALKILRVGARGVLDSSTPCLASRRLLWPPQTVSYALFSCQNKARQPRLLETLKPRFSPTVRYLWGRPTQTPYEKRGYTPTDEESARDEILGMAFKGRQPAALLMRCKNFCPLKCKAIKIQLAD